jgi:hypothetical protein
MSNTQKILEEFNTVGTSLSKIDSELAKLESYGPNGDGSKMYPHSVSAHSAVAVAGAAMERAAQLLQQDIDNPAPPSNIGNVGGGSPQGHGPIPPGAMTFGNWSYYQQHNLGAQWASIFSGTLDEVNAAIGSNPGSIATAPQDPIVPGGYPSLATWG